MIPPIKSLSQDFGGEGEEIVAGMSEGQGPRCLKVRFETSRYIILYYEP